MHCTRRGAGIIGDLQVGFCIWIIDAALYANAPALVEAAPSGSTTSQHLFLEIGRHSRMLAR